MLQKYKIFNSANRKTEVIMIQLILPTYEYALKVIIFLDIMNILIPTLIVSGLALVLGLVLGVVSKVFAVPVNQLEKDISDILPQANCGACGFTGCSGYAQYLAGGGDNTGMCPVGGNDLSIALSEKLGVEAKSVLPTVAHVMCKGSTDHTKKRFEYNGTLSCRSAQTIFSGPNSCTYGCMGYGDCLEACPYSAIDIIDGIAVVNDFKCKACGLCVSSCPKSLIFMIPKYETQYKVECRNRWPGAQTRKNCSVGCIGCQKCFKVCPSDAITMDGPLAVIDQSKCTSCDLCREACPTKSISGPIKVLIR